jgi:hypothetical protein
MIHVVCAKSNNIGLEAILTMANDLNKEMDSLSVFLGQPLALDPLSSSVDLVHVRNVADRVQKILEKIEDAVPYINLALSVSGAKLGTMQTGVSSSGNGLNSISMLLNASSLLQSACRSDDKNLIPMGFPCRVYRLFDASVRAKGVENWTWKLEHLASLAKVYHSTPQGSNSTDRSSKDSNLTPSHLLIQPYRFDGSSGVNATDEEEPLEFLLSELHSMYFTATGRLLNIPDSNPGAPVLVLHLKEYIAIEILTADEIRSMTDSDSEDSDAEDSETDTSPASDKTKKPFSTGSPESIDGPWSHQLALLETILRLVAVENALSASHLSIPDDLLNVYLSSNQTPSSLSMDVSVGAPPIHYSPQSSPMGKSRSKRTNRGTPQPNQPYSESQDRTGAPARALNLMEKFIQSSNTKE